MAVINLPTMEQMDIHNTLLASIASHVGTEGITISNWADVQRLVRMGLHTKMFVVGDQFIAEYGGTPYTIDIIGINHDTPTDSNFTNSLTLQFHDCLMNCVFDAPELLYYAEAELVGGAYYFYDSYNTVNYKFTTTQAIPLGGNIKVSAWGASNNPTEVKTYDASDVLLETLAVSESDVGTLITCNDLRRVRYGSNNYEESNIRQFLNSEDSSFAGTKQTNFDVLTTSAPYDSSGFLYNLDPDLVAVIGAVDKQVARNTVTDSGGQDEFSDKVFLLSRVEAYGDIEGTTTGESAYEYYSNLAESPTAGALEGRIKYLASSARIWWLRSPDISNSSRSRYVTTTGGVHISNANGSNGLSPACCIV